MAGFEVIIYGRFWVIAEATSLSDGAVESALGAEYREEIFFDLGAFRLRCIVRCHCSLKTKQECLFSAKGTVLKDLQGKGSHQADLNILFSLFTRPPREGHPWQYNLFLNIHPSVNPGETRLPAILTNPFLMAEMLTDGERERNAARLL